MMQLGRRDRANILEEEFATLLSGHYVGGARPLSLEECIPNSNKREEKATLQFSGSKAVSTRF